jgi:predicted double-glycine peptidase
MNDSYYKRLDINKKERFKELATNRLSDEIKYMKAKYDGIFNREKNKKNNNNYVKSENIYKCYFTREEFLKTWENHKKIYGGLICAITGEPMTHIGLNPKNKKKYSRNWNNISIDKLDPDKPYTLENIIFVTWKINKAKNDLPIKYLKRILELYNQRFNSLN